MTASVVGPGGTVFIDPAQLPLPVTIESSLWFTYAQGTADDVWEFDHPLPGEPSITVFDSAGTQIFPDITHTSGHVVLDFGGVAMSGRANLR